MLKNIQGIQRKIEELQPQAFPGENIKEYSTAVLALTETLTNASQSVPTRTHIGHHRQAVDCRW
jgi:hypothetical protein